MWGADGSTPIPIRWMLVVDPTGKMDPLPLMSTDPLMTPEQMIELYVDRWSIEVMFEETREQRFPLEKFQHLDSQPDVH